MSKQASMSGNLDIPEDVEMGKRLASIKTALFLLTSSLALTVAYYLLETYCC